MIKHLPISIVILAFVVLAALYSAIIPLGEGPDEPGHAAYVFFLAREGRLPVQHIDKRKNDVPGEGHQPPLAYLLATPAILWLPQTERQFDLPGNTHFTWAGGNELNAAAHGSREYLPWRGIVLAWHAARLTSVALGAITVLCTYMAAHAMSQGNHQLSLLAAMLVAFNPQFLFTSALITNDALLVALSAGLLALLVRVQARGSELFQQPWLTRRALGVGVLSGLALITKQSAVILVPIALVGLFILPLCFQGDVAAGEGRVGDRKVAMQMCAVVLSVTALVAGWWYIRNWHLYGDPFGVAVFQVEFMTQPFETHKLGAWSSAMLQLHDSFWARFGWMNVYAPSWIIGLYTGLELIGLIGLSREAVCMGRLKTIRYAGVYWLLIAFPALALAWVISFAITAGLVAWQGRFLFPALPAIAILLAYGLKSIRPWRHNSTDSVSLRSYAVLSLLVISLLAVALCLPFGVIRPAYPFHTLPETVAQMRIGTPVYGRFAKAGEQGAELRGWRVEGSTYPGGTMNLTLMWHALARQNRDWTVFIHLVDGQDQIVAEDNRKPQNGAFPMTQWVTGDWVEDQHQFQLPTHIAPGSYTVRIGLYDPKTGRRTGQYNQRGKLSGDSLDVGRIVVQGR